VDDWECCQCPVLPIPISNGDWGRVVGVVFRCRCRADIYYSFLPLPLSSISISDLELSPLFTFTFNLHLNWQSATLATGSIGNGNTITRATFTAFPTSSDREENPKDRYMRCRYRRKSEFGRGRSLSQFF